MPDHEGHAIGRAYAHPKHGEAGLKIAPSRLEGITLVDHLYRMRIPLAVLIDTDRQNFKTEVDWMDAKRASRQSIASVAKLVLTKNDLGYRPIHIFIPGERIEDVKELVKFLEMNGQDPKVYHRLSDEHFPIPKKGGSVQANCIDRRLVGNEGGINKEYTPITYPGSLTFLHPKIQKILRNASQEFHIQHIDRMIRTLIAQQLTLGSMGNHLCGCGGWSFIEGLNGIELNRSGSIAIEILQETRQYIAMAYPEFLPTEDACKLFLDEPGDYQMIQYDLENPRERAKAAEWNLS